MSQRETNLLWMRDLIEHLSECQQQLMWSSDPSTVSVLADRNDVPRPRALPAHLRAVASYTQVGAMVAAWLIPSIRTARNNRMWGPWPEPQFSLVGP